MNTNKLCIAGLSLSLLLSFALFAGCSTTDDTTDGAGGNDNTGTGGKGTAGDKGVDEGGAAGADTTGVTCTAVEDVDCAKAREAYQTVCDLGCSDTLDCTGTTEQDVEDYCDALKLEGSDATQSYACFYTNGNSCEDFSDCFQTCTAEVVDVCTALEDVDCTAAGEAYATVCDLGCETVGTECAEITAEEVTEACEGMKEAGTISAQTYACFYTNQDSCEDFDSCYQPCGE